MEERDMARDAESVFANWALRVEDGDEQDFEQVVAAHPELAPELRALHEEWRLFAPILAQAAPGLVSMDSQLVLPSLTREGDPEAADAEQVLARLGLQSPRQGRYKFRALLGRGGGGVVLKVWDSQLNRPLAMKVVLGPGSERSSGQTPRVDERTLTRFVDEARIASQLNHPGIVPVHELGADESGRAFFTMKLVKGETFASVLDKVRAGEAGWSTTRALNVLLRVCEAMAYAHDRGVIHRDLKPANVMVGPYGEVYVMDWGLARVVAAPGARASDEHALSSLRRELRDQTPSSSLETTDGQVVGTPAYMSPEQAHGETARIGPQSDVYAIGAMLYHLVSGAAPYASNEAAASLKSTLRAVREGPPPALERVAPRVPPELAAICERAMARELDQRYATVPALADDLRAFLERRVVGAYESGALAEARSWVRRNRQTALWMAAFALAVSSGGVLSGWKAVEAAEARDDAQQRANDVLALSAQFDLDRLVSEAETLWPPHPERIDEYEDWLARFRALIDGAEGDSSGASSTGAMLERHRARLALLRERAAAAYRSTSEATLEAVDPTYSNSVDAWWDRQLSALIQQIEAMSDPAAGVAGDAVRPEFGWGIAKRLAFARSIEERSRSGASARELWAQAIAAIERSPKYGGLRIPPQLGLLPLGPDSQSGLWEFAHLMSGEPAVRNAEGRLVLEESTGIVLVLIPAGEFLMGAQAKDASAPNFDPSARANEGPVHTVELASFFIAKHEMTQAQWLRIAGHNPSFFNPAHGVQPTLLHPVESVGWTDAMLVLPRLGLTLPSESQWEYAARAGTQTPWWCGADRECLKGAANLGDQSAKKAGANWQGIADWPKLEDGWVVHAPVDVFRSNGFGLHHVAGNVWEWVLDGHDNYTGERVVDPLKPPAEFATRTPRGGCFIDSALFARVTHRSASKPDYRAGELGLRAARGLER